MSTNAQKKSRKEQRADKNTFNYSFDKAIYLYSHTKNLSVEGQRKLAQSYVNINQNIKAEEVYTSLIIDQKEIILEDYYNYAMVLKSNSKYEQSNIWMGKFTELKPQDLRAISYATNNKQLSYLLKDDEKYKIEHLNINTTSEDFGPTYYNNNVVFTSTITNPKMIVRIYRWTQKPFWDMYMSEIDGSQLKTPIVFDKHLNGNMHDGPASFGKDGNYMAFTRSNYNDKTKDRIVELQIWFSNYVEGKWSEPTPFYLNNNGYSVGQPCLANAGKTMYFTSDMPGGYGGTDIYKTIKDSEGNWGTPKNMGNRINTEGDEMFPFFEETNQVMFFASNGHFGLGGLDIFICEISGDRLGRIYNAGFPLNTQYDDFSLIVNSDMSKGFFSSNRVNGSGGDDIYSIDVLKKLEINKKIQGIVKDKEGNHIPTTFITFLDDKGNIIDTITTKADGTYSFFADTDKNFKLIGNKEKYIEASCNVNTFGKEIIVNADIVLFKETKIEGNRDTTKSNTVKTIEKTDIIEIIVEQNPKKTPTIKEIRIGDDLGKILELKTMYFDLDKFNIRPEYIEDLDKIVKIMNEYPDMVIELSGHTDCRATKEYNQKLSNKRAKVPAWYIKKRITNSKQRVFTKAYGETKPINDCFCEGNEVSKCSEEENQKNRRTEFIIIKK